MSAGSRSASPLTASRLRWLSASLKRPARCSPLLSPCWIIHHRNRMEALEAAVQVGVECDGEKSPRGHGGVPTRPAPDGRCRPAHPAARTFLAVASAHPALWVQPALGSVGSVSAPSLWPCWARRHVTSRRARCSPLLCTRPAASRLRGQTGLPSNRHSRCCPSSS